MQLNIFALMKDWNVSLAVIQLAIPFACFNYFQASFPPALSEIYHFTPDQVGLCSLSSGIGSCLGSIVPGKLSDWYCARKASRNNGMKDAETRLRLSFYILPVIMAGTLSYGWFLQAELPWIAPNIALAVSEFVKIYYISSF